MQRALFRLTARYAVYDIVIGNASAVDATGRERTYLPLPRRKRQCAAGGAVEQGSRPRIDGELNLMIANWR